MTNAKKVVVVSLAVALIAVLIVVKTHQKTERQERQERQEQRQQQEQPQRLLPTSLNRLDKVQDGIFISNLTSAMDDNLLKKHGITHVINLSGFEYQKHPGIAYLDLPISDVPAARIYTLFSVTNPYISSVLASGGAVLVHCQAGISRSASIVLAYLIANHGYTLDTALNLLREKRPIIRPNPGFIQQLQTYRF